MKLLGMSIGPGEAQVTEFPLVQDSLALMDETIDNAILRAGGLPLVPPDSLTHLTSFTPRSLPCDLGGLGIRRLGGLTGKILVYGGAQSSTNSQKSILLDFWKGPP
jgi:hypothetical protein